MRSLAREQWAHAMRPYRVGGQPGCSFALGLAALTDYPGFYMIGLIALHYLIFGPRQRRTLVFAAGLGAYAVLLFGFWVGYAALVSGSVRTFAEGAQLRAGVAEDARFTFAMYYALQYGRIREFFTPALRFLAVVWGVFFVLDLRKRERWLAHSWIVLLLGYGLANLIVFRQGSWVHDYWLFFFSPFFAVAAAVAVREFGRRVLGGRRALVAVLLLLIWAWYLPAATGQLQTFYQVRDPAETPLARWLNAHTAFEEGVLVGFEPLQPHFDYYLDRRLAEFEDTTGFERLAAGGRYRWAVLRSPRTLDEDLVKRLMRTYPAQIFEQYLIFDLEGEGERLVGPEGDPQHAVNRSIAPGVELLGYDGPDRVRLRESGAEPSPLSLHGLRERLREWVAYNVSMPAQSTNRARPAVTATLEEALTGPITSTITTAITNGSAVGPELAEGQSPSSATGSSVPLPTLSPQNGAKSILSLSKDNLQQWLSHYLYSSSYQPERTGSQVEFTLYWRAGDGIESDVQPVVRLAGSDGVKHYIAEVKYAPVTGLYSTGLWQSGEVIRAAYRLELRPDDPAGVYRLEVDGPEASLLLGYVTVERGVAAEGMVACPALAHEVDVSLEGGALLAGYQTDRDTYQAGDTVRLQTCWQQNSPVIASPVSPVVASRSEGHPEPVEGQSPSPPGDRFVVEDTPRNDTMGWARSASACVQNGGYEMCRPLGVIGGPDWQDGLYYNETVDLPLHPAMLAGTYSLTLKIGPDPWQDVPLGEITVREAERVWPLARQGEADWEGDALLAPAEDLTLAYSLSEPAPVRLAVYWTGRAELLRYSGGRLSGTRRRA